MFELKFIGCELHRGQLWGDSQATGSTGVEHCLSLFSSEVTRSNGDNTIVSDAQITSLPSEIFHMLIGKCSHTFAVLSQAIMEKVGAMFNSSTDNVNSNEVELLRHKVRNILGDNGIILCPAHPTLAPFHYQSYTKPFNFLYTGRVGDRVDYHGRQC